MSAGERTVKAIAEEVLGSQRVRAFWTANHYGVLPIAAQSYDIGAILPAVLYMTRWGHRRGKGRFGATFSLQIDDKLQVPTIGSVASALEAATESRLSGFGGEIGRAVLGDLLQTWCLENRSHATGHDEPVQRVYPAHYLASWIDLPGTIAHLRQVPEMLVALLADQPDGEWLEIGRSTAAFPIGVACTENPLLKVFGRHMGVRGRFVSDVSADRYDDAHAHDASIDELLMVRLAEACGGAPLKARGSDGSDRIANRLPLARRAAAVLRADLMQFIGHHGQTIPRPLLMPMLEAGIALGLTQVILSTSALLSDWERSGQVQALDQQRPWPLFVDASQGQDRRLREVSEMCTGETLRRHERLAVTMMVLRVLEDRVRVDRKLRDQLPAADRDSTALINLLGDVLHERHPRSQAIADAIDEDAMRLAEALSQEGQVPDIVERLREGQSHPAIRLGEALCQLMGDKLQRGNHAQALESALMTDSPHGLATKRRVYRAQPGGHRESQDLRAVVLQAPMLDFLVHRFLADGGSMLSLPGFLRRMREDHGLYIDQEPPGQSISQQLLADNKRFLERRLRDLGLLIGVNDAEGMKQIKPRYDREVNTHAA